MNELKNCPFCSGDEITIMKMTVGTFRAFCGKCRASIAGCNDTDEAERKWNTRADGWISVDDELPQVDFEVLVASDDDVMTSIFREGFVQGEWWFDCEVDKKWRVTHWMPLPEPPKK